MFDEHDMTDREYVTEEQSREFFPDGIAELVDCMLCGVALLLPPGVPAICTLHRN